MRMQALALKRRRRRALLDVVVKAFPGALSAVLFTFIAVMHL